MKNIFFYDLDLISYNNVIFTSYNSNTLVKEPLKNNVHKSVLVLFCTLFVLLLSKKMATLLMVEWLDLLGGGTVILIQLATLVKSIH